MNNERIKQQFNKQAKSFADWSVGKNVEYLQAFFDFCGFGFSDHVLDVACGPGVFPIYMSSRVGSAFGVDISNKEIEIADRSLKQLGITNTSFDCCDVENLSYQDGSFSGVVCKSAFHHFTSIEKVFMEMTRCCKQGGQICIQDIQTYNDCYINDFFEGFDKLVDISHNRALSLNDFRQLYFDQGIKRTFEIEVEVDLNVKEYIKHAIRDDEYDLKLKKLLNKGLSDPLLKKYLFKRGNEIYFKRPVLFIKGVKHH